MGGRHMVEIEQRVRKFITGELMRNPDPFCLEPEEPLLRKGMIDSIGIQQLVAFLESEFDLSISDDDLTVENFQTLRSISELVKTLRSS